MGARRMVTKEMKARYQRGSRRERSAILEELCALTGWHRDHARKAVRAGPGPGQPRPSGKTRQPVRKYGRAVIEALLVCGGTSAATIDRRLAPERKKLELKGRSHTKPGSLTVIDIATGWTEVRGARNKSAHTVFVAQNNWDIARRTVGYWRYDTAGELDPLNQIWPTLSPLINLFTPSRNWSPRPAPAPRPANATTGPTAPTSASSPTPAPTRTCSTRSTPADSPSRLRPPTPPPAARSPGCARPRSNASAARPSPDTPRPTAPTSPAPRPTTPPASPSRSGQFPMSQRLKSTWAS